MGIIQSLPIDSAEHTNNVMSLLTNYGLIEVKGDDAKSFLLGLSTSDVKLVSASLSQFSSICDNKGRVLASFIIFKREDVYYLFLPVAMVETVIRKLKMHVLRAKVSITDCSENLKLLGLSGHSSFHWLTQALAVPAQEPIQGLTIQTGEYTVISLPGEDYNRWLVVSNADAMKLLYEALKPNCSEIDKDEWGYLDTVSGVPFIVPATAGEYLPQMLNLESLGGLSFTKGCYPGQEVVARLHYRGKLKRKLFVALTEASSLPEEGSPLYHAEDTQTIGHVLSAARHSNGQVALQVVLEIDQQSQGDVVLAGCSQSKLIFAE